MACFFCFQEEICAVLCLKEDERWPLTESLFFWRLQQWYFSFALRFLSSLLKSILIVMKLCFLIDDNMHWALIDLFFWYSFCIQDYEFSAVALAWLATSALKMLQAILCLKEMLGFDWIFVFWRPKNLDFLFLLSLSRVLFDCDCDETVLFELMITCTGLWLTCFVILFLYSRPWVFLGCSRLACYFCFENVTSNFVPQGNAWLWLNLCFLET